MPKVLIVYVSRTGNTKTMAEFIAEGVRMAGHEAEVKPVSAIESEAELEGFDGFVFGCPTYHRDMTGGMKTFLFLAHRANLVGKMGGAFCSYTHSGESGGMIFDTMQHVFKMDMVDLGALNLKEEIIGGTEGNRACQAYGRALAEKFGG